MKKIVLTITALLLLCSCNSQTEIGDEVELDIVEVEYDGHSYIVFGGHGVIHNQKCKCYE